MLHSKYHYVNVIEESDNILPLVLYLYLLFIKILRLNNLKNFI